MMLKNISFEGFTVKSSKLQVNDIAEQGTFNVVFSEIDLGFLEPKEETPQQIIMTFEVNMIGHAEGTDPEDPDAEPAFEAEFVIETTFRDLNERVMSEDDINENRWFFENFNQVALKIASENTFKNSEISYMPIPWTGRRMPVTE